MDGEPLAPFRFASDRIGCAVSRMFAQLDQFAIAYTVRLAGSVPRAVASALRFGSRSLLLAVLIRTPISVRRTLICNPI